MRLARLLLIMLPLMPTSLAAANLSGDWTIDGDVQGNAVNLSCALKQGADAKFAGKCDVNGIATEIDGTVKDNDFTFAFTVGGYSLTYTGKIQGRDHCRRHRSGRRDGKVHG